MVATSKASRLKHYYANKQQYFDRNEETRKRLKQYVKDIKTGTPCIDCGNKFPPFCMDFDHLGDKIDTINKFVTRGSMKNLIAEIAKCELVCSNCHRLRTHSRICRDSTCEFCT